MMESLGTQAETLKFIIARREGEVTIFLGLYLTRNHKILARSWFQGEEEENPGPGVSEARFAGDDFLGKVMDHGPSAVFAHQAG
jgi:hypothetical protein